VNILLSYGNRLHVLIIQINSQQVFKFENPTTFSISIGN